MRLNFFKPFAEYVHPHRWKIFWGLMLLVGTQIDDPDVDEMGD